MTPPIQVMPRRRWFQVRYRFPPEARDPIRAQSLLDAVFRYRAEGLVPNADWWREFAEILVRNLP